MMEEFNFKNLKELYFNQFIIRGGLYSIPEVNGEKLRTKLAEEDPHWTHRFALFRMAGN